MTPYITSTSLSIAQQTAVAVASNTFTYTLPAQSVTTFVGVQSITPPTLATPTASPTSGRYTSPQTLTLTCPAGATTGYTNDGTLPTTDGGGTILHGTTYTTPFSQSVPATINIICTESGFTDSSIANYVYTLTGATGIPTLTGVIPY